jgi:hypothetical protein
METNINHLNKCPNCGSLLEGASLVCEACGFVLHQSVDSSISFDKISSELESGLLQIKSNRQISALDSLKKQNHIIFPMLAVLCLVILLFSYYDSELNVLLIPVMLLFIALSFFSIRYRIKNKARIKLNLKELEKQLGQHVVNVEKYYGQDFAVKSLLSEYQREFELLAKTKKRDRFNTFTGYLLLAAVMAFVVSLMQWKDDYDLQRDKENEIIEAVRPLELYSPVVKPLRNEVNGNFSEYIELSGQPQKLKFKVLYQRIEIYLDSVGFIKKKSTGADTTLDWTKLHSNVHLLDDHQMSLFPCVDLPYNVISNIDTVMLRNKKKFYTRITVGYLDAKTTRKQLSLLNEIQNLGKKNKYFVVTAYLSDRQ